MKIFTDDKITIPLLTKVIRRPGVATNTWIPSYTKVKYTFLNASKKLGGQLDLWKIIYIITLKNFVLWYWSDRPLFKNIHFTCIFVPNLLRILEICFANSLVGANIITCGLIYSSLKLNVSGLHIKLCKIGIT